MKTRRKNGDGRDCRSDTDQCHCYRGTRATYDSGVGRVPKLLVTEGLSNILSGDQGHEIEMGWYVLGFYGWKTGESVLQSIPCLWKRSGCCSKWQRLCYGLIKNRVQVHRMMYVLLVLRSKCLSMTAWV